MDETTAGAGRSRRGWIWVVLVALVLLALPAMAVLLADREAPERVARFVAAAKAEWLALPPVRAAARGEGDSAVAWQHHERALRIVATWPQELRDIDTMPEIDAAKDAIAWRDHRGLVAPLFAALRDAAASPAPRRPLATNGDFDETLARADLGRIGCREIRARIDEGASSAAVAGSLDLATLVGDLTGDWTTLSQLQAMALLGALCDAWTPERVVHLSAEDRDRLAAGLAELDNRLPWELPCRYDLAAHADSLADIEKVLGHFGGRLESWRHGFSPRVMLCAAIEELSVIYASLPAAMPDQPWSQRDTQLRKIVAAARGSANPWVQRLASNVVACELGLRRGRAGLRLLRLELAWRSGREPTSLMDPTADGPIVVEVDGNVNTFRAVDAEVAPRTASRDR